MAVFIIKNNVNTYPKVTIMKRGNLHWVLQMYIVIHYNTDFALPNSQNSYRDIQAKCQIV